MKPPRRPWGDFPDVLIHAAESLVKRHPAYHAAKSGDAGAALKLVRDVFDAALPNRLREVVGGRQPVMVSAHAYEREGVNAIPEVLADVMAKHLGWQVDSSVVQNNVVTHTGADGFPGWRDSPPSTAPWLPTPTTSWSMILSVWAARWRTFAGISSRKEGGFWRR